MGQSYKNIMISDESLKVLEDFTLPQDLAFGKVMAPVMIEADYAYGKWGDFKMLPYHKLTLDPTCKVLHYGQEIFEGLKAYHADGAGPFLFRPDENAQRFNLSAERMAMPAVPEELFLAGCEAITSYCAHLIPQESGSSLYIRPFMFATDDNLGIKPSETFKFMIVASPSAAYFSSGSVKVLVERSAARACPGGVGHAKTGGNYAASLYSMIEAKKAGFDQVLWLDAVNKQNIEEMSGMNFFAVYGDTIKTPALTETILNGITRKSITKLAPHLGLKVEECQMNIDQLLSDIKEGKCSESFACGTAVIITPISALGTKEGESYQLEHEQGPVSTKLRSELLNIQEGRSEDPFGWRLDIPTKLK